MYTRNNTYGPILACLCMMLLSACGFQLRGHGTLPPGMERIYLQSDVSPLVTRHLRQSLAQAGAQLVATAESATAIMHVDGEEQGRGILSVSETARVREYESRYRIRFSVKSAAGDVIIPQQTIEQRRDYSFNENEILAKEREEARLIRDMQVQAVQGMLRKMMYTRSATQP